MIELADCTKIRPGDVVTVNTARYGMTRGTVRKNFHDDRALLVTLPDDYAAPQIVPYDYVLTVTPPTPEPEAP